MLRVVPVQHSSGDVRNITSSVTFTSNINLEVLDAKELLEILEESHKVLGSLFLGCGIRLADRETCTNWLLDPVARNIRPPVREIYGAQTYQSTLVKFTHEYGFSTGANVPGCHVNRPFSWKKPSRELHPGPPLSQIVISSTGSPSVGWKTKKRALDLSSLSIGTNPEYISPTSKGTSGRWSTL